MPFSRRVSCTLGAGPSQKTGQLATKNLTERTRAEPVGGAAQKLSFITPRQLCKKLLHNCRGTILRSNEKVNWW